MKKLLILTELLMNAADARAADDGTYTPDKDYFLATLLAAIDVKNECGVAIDADAINAGAARIHLDLETARRRYPRPFYATIQRHLQLRDGIRVAGKDRVCRYLIGIVDRNPQFEGWKVQP